MSCSCLNSRKKYYERYKECFYISCFPADDMLLRKAEKESLNSEALRAYFSFLFYLVFWNDLISEEASSKEWSDLYGKLQ